MTEENTALQQSGFISEKIKIFLHEKFILDKMEAETDAFFSSSQGSGS